MVVQRITANLPAVDPQATALFYSEVFGLQPVMDLGFIVTTATDHDQPGQLSFASQGGSETELPALSIEVDDLEPILSALAKRGITPNYGPIEEEWGVRRFYFSDIDGHLINVLMHSN